MRKIKVNIFFTATICPLYILPNNTYISIPTANFQVASSFINCSVTVVYFSDLVPVHYAKLFLHSISCQKNTAQIMPESKIPFL